MKIELVKWELGRLYALQEVLHGRLEYTEQNRVSELRKFLDAQLDDNQKTHIEDRDYSGEKSCPEL